MPQTKAIQPDPVLKARYDGIRARLAQVEKEIDDREALIRKTPEYQKLFKRKQEVTKRLWGYYVSDDERRQIDLDLEKNSTVDKDIEKERDVLAEPFVTDGHYPSYGTSQYRVGIQTNIRDWVFEAMKQAGFPKSKLRASTIEGFVGLLIKDATEGPKGDKLRALLTERSELISEENTLSDAMSVMNASDKDLVRLRAEHGALWQDRRGLEEPVLHPEAMKREKEREDINEKVLQDKEVRKKVLASVLQAYEAETKEATA